MKAKQKSDAGQPIRLLHLSDFHFRSKTKWDWGRLLASLPDAIADFVHNDMAPHVVAITGDIAHAGKAEEYKLARDWIDHHLVPVLPKGFERDRVLLVPGNHDVDREAVKAAAQSLQDDLLKRRSQERVANTLRDSDDRRVLLKRHAAYLRFANEYRPSKQKLKVPWWSTVRKFNGCRVYIAGLCSSWMSWSEQDQGKLLIGRWQVNALFKDAPDDVDFRIVMLHHPWDYLAEFDRREIQETVARRADLVLRGHLHAQRSTTIFDPDNLSIELAAGSVYDRSEHANAFQLIELRPADRTIRVHYRTWRNGAWLPALHAYKNAPEGVATFSLAKHPAGPPDPTAYLEQLCEESRYIDIRGLRAGSGKADRFPIDELYIPLAATAAVAGEARRQESPEEAP